ncbi:cytochrome C biogenesis protein CcmH [Clostridium botulinum]|uniref:Ig-like domain-containing protein n=1 Tax=Clostridium botulinum TaxID=1491 RepID=UPI0003658A00|nr:Ig-like domain-containing protein [Clostridium botulinum]MBN1035864.1 cytochrome C biogenesis protein CcmH [Clostridium botulinum]MBN1065168.1 cytochrome C biogenesis protein CcmH [Clostridium botulinum]NFG57806.1 Ig domain-containing protein [Clostridium botulinum]
MKNYYKRILIMFVMVLTVMSVGIIKNEIAANAATVGEQLLQPEEGWTRYDDEDSNIKFIGENWGEQEHKSFLNGKFKYASEKGAYVEFKFYGTKLRFIGAKDTYRPSFSVTIDDTLYNEGTEYGDMLYQALLFEVKDLPLKEHTVKIQDTDDGLFIFDSIDIDDTGYLVDPNSSVSSISLDKRSLTLKEGDSKKLTATTTPSAVDIEWSSSDETIAKVDKNGKVIGIKEGTCTVIAQIKGTDVKATCEATVTKEDIVEPEEPSIENGSLYIEMIDGNIKRADKSQIEKFKKWFISRDLDETESPIFKITNAKGNAEYLVHDKVVGFEIRE